MAHCCVIALLLLIVPHDSTADKKSTKEALQVFNDLIGSWKATGTPEGTREDKQRGFWTERTSWEWQFKGDDAWLQFVTERGKHFTKGDLRYVPMEDQFRLTLATPANEKLVFLGSMKDNVLTMTRTDEQSGEGQRLVLKLLHSNRMVYSFETKQKNGARYAKRYQVGATKEGEPFASSGSAAPVCIVSGGLGTMRVSHKGQTYYVCCGGCQTAFNEDPEKFIKEFEAKKKK